VTAVRRAAGQTRVEFRPGARLTAHDLQAAADHARRLHGLHVRALHDTWGIALGYEVALDSSRRQVRVGPGLAYDCNGEELLLRDAIAIPGPMGRHMKPVAFDLILRAADSLDPQAARARDSVCVGAGGTRSIIVRWALAGATSLGDRLPTLAPGVRLGSEVPLGRFIRATDGTLDGPDPSISRRARPLLRPHIGVGRANGQRATCERLICQLKVDTKEAGFSGTPLYLALVGGGSVVVAGAEDLLVGPFVSITDPAKDGFTLQVIFALRPSPITDTRALEVAIKAAMAKASFDWLGLEPFGGCPPNPSGRFFINFGGQVIEQFDEWPGLFELLTVAGGNS
jgi:hypothetical protein